MQITSRFTIAIHALAFIQMFQDQQRVTSNVLAASIQANPVIIRTVLSKLKEAGIIDARQGSGGYRLARPLEEISLYDIYQAVESVHERGLFHFHEIPIRNVSSAETSTGHWMIRSKKYRIRWKRS